MHGPRIITAAEIGLEFEDVFGELGAIYHVTGHLTASARAGDWRQAVATARALGRLARCASMSGRTCLRHGRRREWHLARLATKPTPSLML